MSISYGPSYRSVDLHIELTFSIFAKPIPRPLKGLHGLVWSIGGLIQTKTNNFSATFLSNSTYKLVRCNTVGLILRERELPSIIMEAKGLSVREWGKVLQTQRSNIPSIHSSNWGHRNTEAKLPYPLQIWTKLRKHRGANQHQNTNYSQFVPSDLFEISCAQTRYVAWLNLKFMTH